MGKKQSKYPSTNGITTGHEMPFCPPKTSQDSLAQIKLTREHLSDIQKYLRAVVHAIHDNPSILNRISIAWGNRPTWQKIVGGVLLFGSLFTIGLLAHLVVLIVVDLVLAAVFVVGSYLVDEHFKTNKHSKEGLTSGILGLATMLELTITALDKVREQLALEIDQFRQENTRFTDSLSKLDHEMGFLHEQLKDLSITKDLLLQTKDKLQGLTHDHKMLNADMGKKVAELALVKNAMGLEIKRLMEVSAVLRGTVETLLPSLMSDAAQRAEFQIKMDTFLKDSSANFSAVAERICQAETDLSICRLALDQSNQCYAKLLAKHGEQVVKFEKLYEQGMQEQKKHATSIHYNDAWMTLFQSIPGEKMGREILNHPQLS